MNKKTKILYFTTSPIIGGAEKQLFELATNLNKNKFEVLVCTIKGEKDGPLLEKIREKGIKTKSLNVNSKWQFYKVFQFYSLLKKEKPDILQSFLFFDNIIARIFGKIAGITIVISGQRNVEIKRSWLRNFLDKITLIFADCIVSNSETGKRILIDREKVAEEKIKVIYNGISLDNIHQSIKDKENNNKTTGFVGHLTKQKGVEYLLKATKELKEKKEDFALKIIGDGSERRSLEKSSQDLSIENLVHFIGHKENAWKYMQDLNVLVLPSLWEGLPNVIMEAMAVGVPVVATNVGGVPELIKNGETGFLVEPKNPKTLAEKIEHVLNLPEEERNRVGEKARRVVKEKFSIEKMVNEHEGLYKKLMN